jgi:hypothetical protein
MVEMAVDEFFDEAVLASLTPDEFRSRSPFPWHGFTGALRPAAFDALLADFPSRRLFEWREGQGGQYYTRPHDRWFLEYSTSAPSEPGLVVKQDLPEVWQRFIDEIETSAAYRRHIVDWLGHDDYLLRLTWHLGVGGSEVSPHKDTDAKYGTQIFYFNTSDDWEPSWGGEIMVLADRDEKVKDPYFSDFGAFTEVDTLGNRSFLFKNTKAAWHGVERLACPPDRYRRLFNVVFERPPRPPKPATPAWSKLAIKARRRLSLKHG